MIDESYYRQGALCTSRFNGENKYGWKVAAPKSKRGKVGKSPGESQVVAPALRPTIPVTNRCGVLTEPREALTAESSWERVIQKAHPLEQPPREIPVGGSGIKPFATQKNKADMYQAGISGVPQAVEGPGQMQDQATTCKPVFKRTIFGQGGLEKRGIKVAHEKTQLDKGDEAKDTLRSEDSGKQE